MKKISILLIDDEPNVRQGLRMLLDLEPDFSIVGEAYDGDSALRLAQELHPDVVLMDAVMPGMDGIAATVALRQLLPDCPIIFLSLYDDSINRAHALAAGAASFVSKRAAPEVLLAVIRNIAGSIP